MLFSYFHLEIRLTWTSRFGHGGKLESSRVAVSAGPVPARCWPLRANIGPAPSGRCRLPGFNNLQLVTFHMSVVANIRWTYHCGCFCVACMKNYLSKISFKSRQGQWVNLFHAIDRVFNANYRSILLAGEWWCHSSLCHQAIGSAIKKPIKTGPYPSRRRVSNTWIASMWKNDIKYKTTGNHWYAISIVVTDILVLTHQAINNHIPDGLVYDVHCS